jgi:hypothetical protein
VRWWWRVVVKFIYFFYFSFFIFLRRRIYLDNTQTRKIRNHLSPTTQIPLRRLLAARDEKTIKL